MHATAINSLLASTRPNTSFEAHHTMYFPPPHLDSVADGTVVCVGLAACADDETGIRRRARRRRHGGTGNNGERVGLRSAGWDTGAGGTLGLWM